MKFHSILACQHIATLNREQAEGKISKKIFADPGNELLKRLGAGCLNTTLNASSESCQLQADQKDNG